MGETEPTAPVAPPAAPEPVAEKTLTPIEELWATAQTQGHPEVWGVTLADPATHVPSQIVLQKYLNANDGDLANAKDQLLKTLEWRAEAKPLELLKQAFSKFKFDGVGYVTSYTDEKVEGPEAKEVFTWNVYGIVKNMDETFGDIDGYVTESGGVKPLGKVEQYTDPLQVYQLASLSHGAGSSGAVSQHRH
jgi:hypothetical protein